MMRRGPIALLNLTFLMVHIVAMSDPLGDPNFIPGTGHGELTPPVLPEVTLRKYLQSIEDTFIQSSTETTILMLLAVTTTIGLLAIGLLAAMNTVGIHRMIAAGDRRKDDTVLIAAYLARNKMVT